jgi:hypothetical protein
MTTSMLLILIRFNWLKIIDFWPDLDQDTDNFVIDSFQVLAYRKYHA